MEAKNMTYIHKHMAEWQTGGLTLKRGGQCAKPLGHLSKHGRLSKVLLYIYLDTSVCQGAKEIVCSCIFANPQSANLKNTWLPETAFGHLQSNKRSRKEARLLPLNGSNIASQNPGGAVSHKDE